MDILSLGNETFDYQIHLNMENDNWAPYGVKYIKSDTIRMECLVDFD